MQYGHAFQVQLAGAGRLKVQLSPAPDGQFGPTQVVVLWDLAKLDLPGQLSRSGNAQ